MTVNEFIERFNACFTGTYKLGDDGKTPEPCTPMEWAEQHKDFIGWTVGRTKTRDAEVSTVFLGMDHNFRHVGPKSEHIPVLFETMIFGGEMTDHQWRYQTWEDAEEGHDFVVAFVKEVEAGGKLPSALEDDEEDDE